MGEEAEYQINRMMGFGSGRRYPRIRHLELTKIHFNKVKGETEKALLLDVKNLGEVWVPKSIISTRSAHTAFVHSNVWSEIVQQSRGLVALLDDLQGDDDDL